MDMEKIDPKIQIKGIREGLLITVGDGPWPEVQQALLEHIDQQAAFLRGARLALELGNHILKAVELGHLRSLISEREINLWAVLSASPTTEQTAQTLGLATRIGKPSPEATVARLNTAIHSGEQALLIHRTLRSGYSLHNSGHIVVIGDINPGAEIIAGGDIFVWGHLRGMVHAGAEGDEMAVVCALDLSPTQLRIAGQIAVTPQRRGKTQPEIARIHDGKVVAEAWNPKTR